MLNWIWIMNIWRKFETDEPENTNVFQYISKWGFGVYNWKIDDERTLQSCMYIRRKSKRRSKVLRRISPNSFKHLNSFHIYNPFGKWHPFKIRKHRRWWGVKITININSLILIKNSIEPRTVSTLRHTGYDFPGG